MRHERLFRWGNAQIGVDGNDAAICKDVAIENAGMTGVSGKSILQKVRTVWGEGYFAVRNPSIWQCARNP